MDDAPARWRLTALAILGIVVYHVVLMAPFVVLYGLLNPWTYHYGPWASVPVLLVTWWILQPVHYPPGRRIRRQDAPALFDDVDRLADQLQSSRVHDIRLTDEFNAGALETTMRWQPWRKARVLLLGIPLLALVDRDTVRSVVAHELGHFSHRHGRLGHWLYRARIGWLDYAHLPPSQVSLLERASAFFARWFAPRFARLCFAHSRQCEYQADATGASLVGPLLMATGLMRFHVISRRWSAMMRDELPRLTAESPSPPTSWLQEVRRHTLAERPSAGEIEALRNTVARTEDTHPSLFERLRALDIDAADALAACDLPRQCAGEQWMPQWDEVRAAHDERWRAAHTRVWHQEHVRRRVETSRLAQLRSRDDRSLQRAWLELKHGDMPVAQELAQAWLHDAAHGATAHYLLGQAQLSLGNKEGIATLETCIKADAAWAAGARELICSHDDLLDSEKERERNRALLAKAVERRSQALGIVFDRLQQGQVSPAVLEEDPSEILRAVYRTMPLVAAAWCAAMNDVQWGDRRYHAFILVLRLRTGELLSQQVDEDQVRDDARQLLGDLLPASTLRLVHTVYTTEALSPELDALLSRWAADHHACCIVTPAANECVGPGARAAALG